MAIAGPNIGTSWFRETGQRPMSAARVAVRLPARPGGARQMIGLSKEVNYNIGANNSYNKDTLINYLRSQGSTPAVVTITGNLVSYSSGVACLEFPANLPNAYVHLIINGGVTLYGRGGNGGVKGNGAAGGHAINNQFGTRLRITNNGAIAGGGGGGGGNSANGGMGGGGRPFGYADKTHPPAAATSRAATDGTLTSPGIGAEYKIGTAVQYTCGSGGNVGANGGASTGRLGTNYGGGSAGRAVIGNAPTWNKVGTIYGARV